MKIFNKYLSGNFILVASFLQFAIFLLLLMFAFGYEEGTCFSFTCRSSFFIIEAMTFSGSLFRDLFYFIDNEMLIILPLSFLLNSLILNVTAGAIRKHFIRNSE